MPTIKIDALDHLVLTVHDLDATCRFYGEALGMTVEDFIAPSDGTRRLALKFGQQKINLHQAGAEFEPKSRAPTPGSADLCFLTATPMDAVRAALIAAGVTIEVEPSRRTGATGQLNSIYCRDPDGNLVEIANLA